MRLTTSLGTSLVTLVLAAPALLVGCSGEDEPPAADTGTGGTGAGGGGGAGAGASGGSGGSGGGTTETPTRATIEGDVTWVVTFDDAAKMAGATDCTYTRHYTGVEDASARWLCPACETMFRANVEVVSGLSDCYSQVSATPPAAEEWLGIGGGQFWRGIGGPMSQQGTAMISGTSATTSNHVEGVEAPVGGTLAFDVTGDLALGEEDGDPMHGFTPPETYACGWPKSDAAPYTGNYVLTVGQTVPDGLFKDSCDEGVRLHDFAGSYLLIDMAAMDCPPCQSMAAAEEQFVADMAAQGIEVKVITLLAPSLNDVVGHTTTQMLETWKGNYQLTSPVLADRGWGLSMFIPAIGDMAGYPSWTLVSPDLVVMEFGTGFGGFADFEAAIIADAQ
jgi:hypothetical protein